MQKNHFIQHSSAKAMPVRPKTTILFILLLAGMSCQSPDIPVLGSQLRAADQRLLDDQNREVILRGINARIEGLFDVTFDDGRIALEPIPPFDKSDLLFLKEQLGMNSLRIPINWSGLEPTVSGTFDTTYLALLDTLLDNCAATEMWCLVDLHQDAYSKEIGEDGAPLWAIIPPPTELLEGPLHDLEARRISQQVLDAFSTFFGNRDGVQDAFVDMLERLTLHLKDKPFVAGLEIFNEPVGEDLEVLQFSRRAIEAIHALDPNRLVVFEPNSLRNLRDYTDPLGGLQMENTAYAPHLYPEIFSGDKNNFANGDTTRLIDSTRAAKDEADIHQAPLMITEYGIDPSATHAVLWMDTLEEEMDRALASRYYWLYEEYSQARWGLYDEDKTLRPTWAAQIARPFPSAIEGTIRSFTVSNDQMTISFTGQGQHRITIPALWAPKGVTATCNGVIAEVTLESGGLWMKCEGQDENEIQITPLS